MLKLTDTFFSLLQYGRNALEIVMKSIVNLDSPMVSPPPDYPGEFFKGDLGCPYVIVNQLVSYLYKIVVIFVGT